MTALNEPLAQAIGWALLQFIWQGALIGALTAAILAALRRSAADVRYVVATIAMSLMLTMPVVTVVQMLAVEAPEAPATSAQLTVDIYRTSTAPPLTSERRPSDRIDAASSARWFPAAAVVSDRSTVESWLPVCLGVWLAGVAVLSLRLLSGWIWVQRMKSHAARPVHGTIRHVADVLLRRLHIGRAVSVLESSLVDVPTVIGWIKPVVLLPASALSGLTPRQLEAILAHELAHIRRHDYLVNLLQSVVETLLFYHPAVWWLSRRIRIERENCCDDLAVTLCGDPVTYAAALAELEGLRSDNGHLVLAATGGSLLQRVKRLLGAPSQSGRAPGWLAAGLAMLVVVGISAGTVGPNILRAQDSDISDDGDEQAVAATPAVPALPATQSQAVTVPAAATTPRRALAATVAAAHDVPLPAVASTAPLPAATAVPAPAAVKSVPAVPAVASTIPVAAAAAAVALPGVAVAATVRAVSARAATQAVSAPATPVRTSQSSGNFTWSDNNRRLDVNYRGDIEFNDTDTDVSRMSPGASLKIKDGGRFFSNNTVEFKADGSGQIERRFWVGSSERPFDPEGRNWLAQMLPRFIRQSAIGAPARVARILEARGPNGVLDEISLVEGSWAKGVYFRELLKTPLDARLVQQALAQAGREIDSDFELASLLIASNPYIKDDASRRALLQGARSIDSDFELHRTLSSLLKNGALPAPVLVDLLETSTTIDSDFELASLLIDVAKLQAIGAATRPAFFKALGTVGSDFEHKRVLTEVLQRPSVTPEVRVAALESAAMVESDFEAATVLLQYVKDNPLEGPARAVFFRALGSIDSAFEKGRVLQAAAKRTDLSDQTVVELIKAAQTISSGFEKSQVLLAVAAGHPLTREGRDAYIDAAEKLGDYEQGRVLTALVKNERQKAR